MNSKPRRAHGGKGLLSRSISVQKPQQSIPLISREERWSRETGRERGDASLMGEAVPFWQSATKEERGKRVFKVPTQGSKIPFDLN